MLNSYTSNRTNFGLKNWVILESYRIESYSEMPIKYKNGYSGGRLCSPLEDSIDQSRTPVKVTRDRINVNLKN